MSTKLCDYTTDGKRCKQSIARKHHNARYCAAHRRLTVLANKRATWHRHKKEYR